MSRRAARDKALRELHGARRLGDVGAAGKHGDDHGVGAGNSRGGCLVAEAGGVHDQHVAMLCQVRDAVRDPRSIRLRLDGEVRPFPHIGAPIGEGAVRVGVNRCHPKTLGGEPAGQHHGDEGLAHAPLARGNRDDLRHPHPHQISILVPQKQGSPV